MSQLSLSFGLGLNNVSGPAGPPPDPTDLAIELESLEGLIELEDGSGYILLE